jgi:ferrous iron transport protein B
MRDTTHIDPETHNLLNHHDTHHHFDTLDGYRSNIPIIVLVGNPNVGKSVFFNYLSGMYVDVSNYPGTTIELMRGSYHFDGRTYDVYDTPGIYGVSSFNDEESVARDVILRADIILDIVDGVHLERDLFLTQQLIDMGKRVVVAVNFMDEVRNHHLEINIPLLSENLGVPVITTTAVTKEGFDKLGEILQSATTGHQDEHLHHELHSLLSIAGSQAEALLILEGDDIIARRHGIPPGTARDRIYVNRRNHVNDMYNRVLTETLSPHRLSDSIGRWTTHPWLGIPILVLVLFLMYLFIGDFVAQRLVHYTENEFGHRVFEYHTKIFAARFTGVTIKAEIVDPDNPVPIMQTFTFPRGTGADPLQNKAMNDFLSGHRGNIDFTFTHPVATVLFGEYGVITMTITYLLFLLLPLVTAFYLSLSLLEDSGYLPRLATLVDRLMHSIGLNGRAVIPLILGFGCVTMATVTTRLLGNEREKTIATSILQFAIPCSAQIAVVAALLAGAGIQATLLYSVIIFSCLAVAGTILSRVIEGETTPLLIDLPPMRIPRLDNVMRKTGIRAYYFMKEATPWFFLGALAVGIMQITGMLTVWSNILEPLTVHWLQLPKEAAIAFVMGLVRRDFGAAGLYSMHLTPHQIVVALVTITLFVPCIASLLVMVKERGVRQAVLIWSGTWILAFSIGGFVSQVLIR